MKSAYDITLALQQSKQEIEISNTLNLLKKAIDELEVYGRRRIITETLASRSLDKEPAALKNCFKLYVYLFDLLRTQSNPQKSLNKDEKVLLIEELKKDNKSYLKILDKCYGQLSTEYNRIADKFKRLQNITSDLLNSNFAPEDSDFENINTMRKKLQFLDEAEGNLELIQTCDDPELKPARNLLAMTYNVNSRMQHLYTLVPLMTYCDQFNYQDGTLELNDQITKDIIFDLYQVTHDAPRYAKLEEKYAQTISETTVEALKNKLTHALLKHKKNQHQDAAKILTALQSELRNYIVFCASNATELSALSMDLQSHSIRSQKMLGTIKGKSNEDKNDEFYYHIYVAIQQYTNYLAGRTQHLINFEKELKDLAQKLGATKAEIQSSLPSSPKKRKTDATFFTSNDKLKIQKTSDQLDAFIKQEKENANPLQNHIRSSF